MFEISLFQNLPFLQLGTVWTLDSSQHPINNISQLLKKSPSLKFPFLMADFENSSQQCPAANHAILDFVTQAAKLIIKTGKGANSCKKGQFVALLSEKHLKHLT